VFWIRLRVEGTRKWLPTRALVFTLLPATSQLPVGDAAKLVCVGVWVSVVVVVVVVVLCVFAWSME